MNLMARSLVRTIVVFCVAVAVAALPLGPGYAPAKAMHAPAATAMPADCCPDGKPCDKGTPDCGLMPGCLAKCASATGAVPMTVTPALKVSVVDRSAGPESRVPASIQAPPAPPPRL
jgi:hypothetical protein